MKARIMMIDIDWKEFPYGTYEFNTTEQKDKVNELAIKIREERDCPTYVEILEE